MILPVRDVIGVSKHRSYRIGYSGLVIVIKGHEEVFLELSSAERRDACMNALEEQRDLVKQRKKLEKEKGDKQDDEHRELRELVDLSATKDTELSSPDMPHPHSEAIPSQPPIMFSSTTSDFVTFRPEKPLRFTCLTIGSRGDVQPYIALCKGLMAQGHHCKIASHAEYQKWVEGHGIDFAPVGGALAESGIRIGGALGGGSHAGPFRFDACALPVEVDDATDLTEAGTDLTDAESETDFWSDGVGLLRDLPLRREETRAPMLLERLRDRFSS